MSEPFLHPAVEHFYPLEDVAAELGVDLDADHIDDSDLCEDCGSVACEAHALRIVEEL